MSYRNWRVTERRTETPSVTTLTLVPEHGEIPKFISGQFVNVVFPHLGEEAKSYSIASAPEDDFLALSVRAQGAFSHALISLAVGDTLQISEPCGFFYPEDETTPKVFVAAGIGIMPFVSMLRHEQAIGGHAQTLILYSNRSPNDVPFLNELSEHEQENRCTVRHFITGENDNTIKNATSRRIVTEDLSTANTQAPNAIFFLCGSIGFVRDMRTLSKEAGVLEENIFTEAFF
ncbi:MAG TPA: hypothetical protein ENJ75_03215 [Candidatus Kaiserbacteria bacterium]|nr:hypothetical protein [Candidatus Kaiserbacteria bacterium]